MKKQLTNYQECFWDKENKILNFVWLSTTKDLDDEVFKNEIKEAGEWVKKYSPDYILLDSQNLQYVITPNLQEWMNEILVPIYIGVGVKKLAVLVSGDLFTKISVEQTIEELPELPFAFRYFQDEKEMRTWLK